MPELTLPIRQRGAMVKVLVRTRTAFADAPPTIRGPYSAYLDTGASDTVVDSGILAATALEAVQVAALHVLGREVESYHEVFELDLALAAPDAEPTWIPLRVLSGPIHPRGSIAALGRDFLRHFQLNYRGPSQQFSLSW